MRTRSEHERGAQQTRHAAAPGVSGDRPQARLRSARCDEKKDAGQYLPLAGWRRTKRRVAPGQHDHTSRYRANVTAGAPAVCERKLQNKRYDMQMQNGGSLAIVEGQFAENMPARKGGVDEYEGEIRQGTLQGR